MKAVDSSRKPVEAGRYDKEYYLQSCGGNEFFQRYGAKMLKPTLAYSLARAAIRPGMRVLDIGCGRGELLYQVRGMGAMGIGTDYAQAALEIAREVSGCPVVQCDAKNLPFRGGSFDRIFLLGVMDHLHSWELEASFKEIGRVLGPGGYVVIHTCANRLYYKNWSYYGRRRIARILSRLGMDVREPSPPRSDEDTALHVNEHSYFSLQDFFKKIGWKARIEPRPNYKMCLNELYGPTLPDDFPLKPFPAWKTRLFRGLLWWPPFNWILAREFFCIASPRKAH